MASRFLCLSAISITAFSIVIVLKRTLAASIFHDTTSGSHQGDEAFPECFFDHAEIGAKPFCALLY
jgi:hypothetical protein